MKSRKNAMLSQRMGMDALKRVENLLKSGNMINLELLIAEEKTFLGGIRPVSFSECLGPVQDSSILLIYVCKKIRSKMNIGAKEAVYQLHLQDRCKTVLRNCLGLTQKQRVL